MVQSEAELLPRPIPISETAMRKRVKEVEASGVPALLDLNGAIFYCDPNSKRIEYKGTHIDGTLVPVATYQGVAHLINIEETYAVTVVSQISEEARKNTGIIGIQINLNKKIIEPDLSACYMSDNAELVTNTVLSAYDIASELGMHVAVSDINRAIIEHPWSNVS